MVLIVDDSADRVEDWDYGDHLCDICGSIMIGNTCPDCGFIREDDGDE